MSTISSKINDTATNSEMNTVNEKEFLRKKELFHKYQETVCKLKNIENNFTWKDLVGSCFHVRGKYDTVGIIEDVDFCEGTVTVSILSIDTIDKTYSTLDTQKMKTSLERFMYYRYDDLITREEFETFKKSFCESFIKLNPELVSTFTEILQKETK